MADMDSEAIHAETISRLVDLAIGAAAGGVRPGIAVEDLVGASGSNPALLGAAATLARDVVERDTTAASVVARFETAAGYLEAAHRRVSPD